MRLPILQKTPALQPNELSDVTAQAVADLLRELKDSEGELGLRIEAHGELRQRGQHSTVIVTVPVASASR